jgi:hypothetical protein
MEDLEGVNFAENERWGFCVSRGKPFVISLARLSHFAEKKILSAMSLGLPDVLRHAPDYAK